MKKFFGVFILFGVLFVSHSFAQIKISEIAWMGTEKSSYDEWIELYNYTEELVNLENWRLTAVDGSPDIKLAGEIPAKSYFLLERTDDSSVENVIAGQIYTGGLKNSGEILMIKNDEEIIDETPTEEWIGGDNSAKKTMERHDFTVSGKEKSAWQTSEKVGGTPQAKNSRKIIFPLPENLEFVSSFERVEITKINPVLKNSDEAWLHFSIISDSAIDITNWEIRNANDSQKFSNLLNSDIKTIGAENISEKEVHLNQFGVVKKSEQNLNKNFTLEENRWILLPQNEDNLISFFIKSSPLNLNKNESFQIIDGGKVLAEKVFAKDLQIIFSEISPNNKENDFFELFIKEGEGEIDLKNMEILHNGKTLFFAKNSLIIQKGDILTFQLSSQKIQESPNKYLNATFLQETGDSFSWEKGSKNGIVSSSGTMEIVLWSRTTWENSAKLADFVCWADKNLNKTETKRFAEKTPENWNGECFKSDKLSKNESIARSEPQTDINNLRDFYLHLRGSPGEHNFIKNKKPNARIKLQSGKFRGKSKVNFTGKESDHSASTDGDGLEDLKKFQWEINGKSCGNFETDGWNWVNENCYLEAQKYNPSYMYFDFENFAEFEIYLKVTDAMGFSDSTKMTISREKEVSETENEKEEVNYDDKSADEGFFAEFLAQTDLVKLKELINQNALSPEISRPEQYLFARDKFTAEQKSRMAKNIGLIFQ